MLVSDDVVLIHIYNNEDISQRQLMEKTDLSLGNINLILHRLVGKGLLKIEKINARQLRYILTPQGMTRCTRKTLSFIKQAYSQISYLQQCFTDIAEQCEKEKRSVCLFGDKDEIYQILIHVVYEQHMDQVFYAKDLTETNENALILLWQEEYEQAALTDHKQIINIIRELDPAALI